MCTESIVQTLWARRPLWTLMPPPDALPRPPRLITSSTEPRPPVTGACWPTPESSSPSDTCRKNGKVLQHDLPGEGQTQVRCVENLPDVHVEAEDASWIPRVHSPSAA